jgi:hypothetical protein
MDGLVGLLGIEHILRGLGVMGGEDDEVDTYYGQPETIEVMFETPHYITSFLNISISYFHPNKHSHNHNGQTNKYPVQSAH